MSQIEALSRQFYAWEQRLRGWEVYQEPVYLEPPFTPFIHHSVPRTPMKDDGRSWLLVSYLSNQVKKIARTRKPAPEEEVQEPQAPYIYDSDEPLTALVISLPKDRKVKPEEIEHLLLMLSLAEHPVSFELIGTSKSIRVQIVCRECDATHIYTQIKGYFPECGIATGNLIDIIPEGMDGRIYDFGLAEEVMQPLVTSKSFDIDPYIGLIAIFESLAADEQAAIQILFTGTTYAWAGSFINAVTDNKGESFFLDAPEMVKLAEEKISSPLFAVVVRVIGLFNKKDTRVAERIAEALIQKTATQENYLIPLDQYELELQYEDVMLRQSHRLGMLLNSAELATLAHFPSHSVHSRTLIRDTGKTKEMPEIYKGHKLVLGINVHQGHEELVSIDPMQRLKHTHIIGATGTGKSTLLLSSIIQDITNGEGVAVLDPHGDLIENIVSWIHPDRHKDVILIDPADSEYPVGFNILTAHSEIEKDILSSDLVAVFKRLSTSWGDQMNSVFANAILAFLESSKGGTLADLRRFLIEKSYREQFLKTVSDPSIVYYWQKEFPLLKSGSIGPILTRLDSFLRPKLIRNMVAQNKSLDFEEILDAKKILLVKLSQGLMGTENSYLLGSFIVSKIQMAAMARQAKAKANRTNFYLYIDEFQNFITPSMSAILSGARKYHLGLILAHQDMQQVIKTDSELASSVLANAGTRICFRIGDTDAKRFESNFAYFEAADLQNLDTGEAIIRIERPENDCNLRTVPLPDSDPSISESVKSMVISASRTRYGTPLKEVEALLQASHEDIQQDTGPFQKIRITEQTTPPPIQVQPKGVKPEPQKRVEVLSAPMVKKEETQHRYLQTLIKKLAESRGFKAVLEELTPTGGRVDVGLLRDELKIAVEISVTTPDTWEMQNIQKCLQAGYNPVIVCSQDKKHLEKIKKMGMETLPKELHNHVLFLEPEAIFLYFDQHMAQEASTEVRVKGYRVKVEYSAVPEQESTTKRNTILKSVSDGMQKKS